MGQKYTLVLKVSSTCSNDIEVGFAGLGGWFKTNVPANSKEAMITITDTWKNVPNTAFENRMTCRGKSITIHQIQLVKGSKNCLNDIGKPGTNLNILVLICLNILSLYSLVYVFYFYSEI